MLELLVAAALTAATPGGATCAVTSARRQADPAMFVVQDADTTIYIFGTFHALDGKTEWFKDRVRRRLRKLERARSRNAAFPRDPPSRKLRR